MQIHVVEQGDSVYAIAKRYGMQQSQIVQQNSLADPNQLVVGQALIIPTNTATYVVKQGDSLWSIAKKLNVTVAQLTAWNELNPNASLRVGQQLVIRKIDKVPAEILAFIEPRGPVVNDLLMKSAYIAAPHITYLGLFSYEARRDGSLKAPASKGIVQVAKETGTEICFVVSNLENGSFSASLARDILQSEAVQNLLLENIIEEAESLQYVTNVMFDFEHLAATERLAYNRFLRKAVSQLHQAGFTVSTALAPKTSATVATEWTVAHDYRAHGEIVDFVLLMTYEWGYAAGPPMAISPLPEVRKVVEYALTEIPAKKIMLGQNLYSYDWTLPYVSGGPLAEAYSIERALQTAILRKARIQYDERAQAPYFHYWDDQKREHVVWFEDARSLLQKIHLVKEFGLRGIGYWKLGLPATQNWVLIDANFNVRK